MPFPGAIVNSRWPGAFSSRHLSQSPSYPAACALSRWRIIDFRQPRPANRVFAFLRAGAPSRQSIFADPKSAWFSGEAPIVRLRKPSPPRDRKDWSGRRRDEGELARACRKPRRDHILDHAGEHYAGDRHHNCQPGAAAHSRQPVGLATPDFLGVEFVYRCRCDHDAIDRLARRLWHKYVFVFSVAGVSAASALCGNATSLTELVVYRGLQGICSAA